MTRLPLATLASLGLVLVLAPAVHAQTGSVAGTVVDESGGVVPGASVTLTGPNVRATTYSDGGGAYRFGGLAAGTYAVDVTLSGFAPARRDAVVVGETAVTVPAIALALAGFGEVVVVSASRVETTLLDAPATMTVLPGTALAASPAQNFGDLLRAVPGLNVIQMSARDISLTSRQATSTLATSQLTLLDGRSIYLDFFGLILWDFIPTNPNDIAQIEVVEAGVGCLGRQRADRRCQHHLKSPRERRAQCDAERRMVRPRRRLDRRSQPRRHLRRQREYGAGGERSLVVPPQRGLLQLGRLPAAGRHDSDRGRPARPDRSDQGGRGAVSGRRCRRVRPAFQNVGTR
jgi:hypothetical protein